jgi:hypothetical protein
MAQEAQDRSRERWDEFIRWGRRFYEWDGFDREERTYKLLIGGRLAKVREELLSGQDWIEDFILACKRGPKPG